MPNGGFMNVEIDDARLKQAFGDLIARGENFTPLTEEIANHLYNLTDEAFDVESSYTGTPWARLSDSTIKAKGHDKILHKEGDLRGSLYSTADSDGAYVGVNATANGYPYPAVHQFGTQEGKVPARPFLPFNEHGDVYDPVIDEIVEMVKDYLMEG